MSTTPNLPGPESLSGRILAFYKRNQLEEYTRMELARTWDTSAGAINHAISPLLAARWLAERTDGDGNRCIIAGPELAGLELTPGTHLAAAIANALAPKATRPRLPKLDMAAIAVQTGPMHQPTSGGRAKGMSLYTPLFQKLDRPNTWLELPATHQGAAAKALIKFRKDHPSLNLRLVKVNDTTYQLQRLEDKS